MRVVRVQLRSQGVSHSVHLAIACSLCMVEIGLVWNARVCERRVGVGSLRAHLTRYMR